MGGGVEGVEGRCCVKTTVIMRVARVLDEGARNADEMFKKIKSPSPLSQHPTATPNPPRPPPSHQSPPHPPIIPNNPQHPLPYRPLLESICTQQHTMTHIPPSLLTSLALKPYARPLSTSPAAAAGTQSWHAACGCRRNSLGSCSACVGVSRDASGVRRTRWRRDERPYWRPSNPTTTASSRHHSLPLPRRILASSQTLNAKSQGRHHHQTIADIGVGKKLFLQVSIQGSHENA